MVKHRNQFGSVDPGDLAAMRTWAEMFATGETVESVAARIQVEPTMDAVIAEVTHGMTAETREVVAEVFRQEFERRPLGQATEPKISIGTLLPDAILVTQS